VALTREQRENLNKAVNTIAKSHFEGAFEEFLFSRLDQADSRIMVYTKSMPEIFPWPLDDGARVIVRQRIIFLILKDAPDSWIVGHQALREEWNESQFEQAMYDKGRCRYERGALGMLDGLCKKYAEEIGNDGLAPVVNDWLEAQAEQLIQLPELTGVDLSAARNNLYRMTQSSVYNMLVKFTPTELSRSGEKIRKNPYKLGGN
jgi:hypothetical protein